MSKKKMTDKTHKELIEAIKEGEKRQIRKLLKETSFGRMALFDALGCAAAYGRIDVCRSLIKAKAPLNLNLRKGRFDKYRYVPPLPP